MDTLFSDSSLSEEVGTKRFLEIKDTVNMYFASATEKCKESKSGLKPLFLTLLDILNPTSSIRGHSFSTYAQRGGGSSKNVRHAYRGEGAHT